MSDQTRSEGAAYIGLESTKEPFKDVRLSDEEKVIPAKHHGNVSRMADREDSVDSIFSP